jgi:hypothetical protein
MRTIFALCLSVLLAAAHAAAQRPTVDNLRVDTDHNPTCGIAPAQEPDDDGVRWRWRAYRDLDCVVEMVEALQGRVSGESATVVVSRDQLERLRTMALRAKDAAARIGR